jgi:hypothetical protein
MKHIATMAMLFNLGVAGSYAQQKPVKMDFSGSNVATTINLQNDTVTDEEILAGTGTLGRFTYRELHADTISPPPQPPSTCSGPTQLYFLTVTGAGVFRFQDGSLLTISLSEGTGSGCVDLTAGLAHLTGTYQITGGTGRLKGASGTLTRTSTIVPLLFNASDAPALLMNTGKFKGTVFGVAEEEERNDERQ